VFAKAMTSNVWACSPMGTCKTDVIWTANRLESILEVACAGLNRDRYLACLSSSTCAVNREFPT
jgi:hypothetical protein